MPVTIVIRCCVCGKVVATEDLDGRYMPPRHKTCQANIGDATYNGAVRREHVGRMEAAAERRAERASSRARWLAERLVGRRGGA